jgi:type IV secretion system protein TrbL
VEELMDPCNPILVVTNPLLCSGSKAVGGAVGAVADSATNSFAESMMTGYDAILKAFITSWLGQGAQVDLTGASVEWFKQSTSVVTLFLVTLGLLFAGINTMRDRNGRPLREVLETLAKVVFVSAAGSLAVQIFLVGGAEFGKWILTRAGLDSSSFAVSVAAVMGAPGLAIIIGLLGILAVLCQWALMFLRGAVLPLLAGFWPVVASSAMLQGGRKGFELVTKWIIAFVIYNPVAACIYALAWRLKGGGDGIGGVINGWILIVLAVLTLPALMRMLAPVTEAMGKAAGGTIAMGITSAAVSAGVAVGAAVATGGASAGGAATGGASAGGAATAGGGGASMGRGAAGAGGSSSNGGAGPSAATGGQSPSTDTGTAPSQPSNGAQATSGTSNGAAPSGGAPAGGSTPQGTSESAPTATANGASGSSSSGLGWQAAQGALSDTDSSGSAEGLVSE